MHERTVQRLNDLDHQVAAAAAQAAPSLGAHRARIAEAASWAADPRSDAEIRDPAAIMLLFDVLVGITIGTLPHAQDFWGVEVAAREGMTVTGERCGTFRCLAGHLVHIGHPGAAVPIPTTEGWHPYTADTLYQRHDRVSINGGPPMAYGDAALTLLLGHRHAADCPASCTGPACACGLRDNPAANMFEAHNSLRMLWSMAWRYTAGVILPPPELAARHDLVTDVAELNETWGGGAW